MLHPARLGEHLPSSLVLPSPVTCKDLDKPARLGELSLHRMSFLCSLDPHEVGGVSPFTVALVVLVKTSDGEVSSIPSRGWGSLRGSSFATAESQRNKVCENIYLMALVE